MLRVDTKSRLLHIFLPISIMGSVFATYWTMIHEKDFVILNDLEEEEASFGEENEGEL